MTITGFTPSTKADEMVQRFEVFTGAGRRREWGDEEKLQIVAESYSGEVSVSAVARRHGLSPGQLFTWRRQSRNPSSQTSPPMFVPAVLDTPAKMPLRRRKAIAKSTPPAAIELEIDGALLRIAPGTDAATIAAVIQALKASS
ncbi:transposase [Agrobacterium sp. LAD9]|uniref:IS66-like element accessory protein TnpA n=1 Tax=Agrobacterium sp. LAD9 TaxID=2055153 RepID=UPI000D1DBDB0|nr:transposase [Agrobacterium sp. LAD9]